MKSRGAEQPSRSIISRKWTIFLCIGSFCAGMFFTNRYKLQDFALIYLRFLNSLYFLGFRLIVIFLFFENLDNGITLNCKDEPCSVLLLTILVKFSIILFFLFKMGTQLSELEFLFCSIGLEYTV